MARLLEGLQDDQPKRNSQSPSSIHSTGQTDLPRVGIGMDSAVIPIRHGKLLLVQTIDFFYPLVDDPYIMGRIACCNVLSDLYALGVIECDNMLMVLGISEKMTEKERDTVIPIMMKGFRDCADEAGTQITGGQTVQNPWLTIGGVATTVCTPNEYLLSENAAVGDVLVLTKPLGIQVVVSAYQWIDHPDQWDKIKSVVTEEDVRRAYLQAMDSMSRLNRIGARLMHKYGAHGATDVTGFGILGHASNLAKNQKNEVSFMIHTLPIVARMTAVDEACNSRFKLVKGYCPETSGGLLICLPREQAKTFCQEIEQQEGHRAWIIGTVEEGPRIAEIIEDPRIIEVA